MERSHFCQEHRTKFYKNEKLNADGQLDVWYSHKKADGSGFCTEPKALIEGVIKADKPGEQKSSSFDSMFACNAMNNAVALASNGKIGFEEIGTVYKKLYSELLASHQ